MAAVPAGVLNADAELFGLQAWLAQLDVLRDGVAAAIGRRQRDLASAVFAATVAQRPVAPPKPRVQKVRRLPTRREPASWWATARPEGFTATVVRDHLARMSASREALMVNGATCDE